MTFQQRLLAWYARNGRDLPWRHTTDHYRILVSEFMLQQTQVDRVLPKYTAWLTAFPDCEALAAASRADVLKLWSGLGYNNRAVRLHVLAKLVVKEHHGALPDDEEALRKLPGIGPYTAGALMAFAQNKPGKCIDVNVERIVKRIFFPKTKKDITKKMIEETFLGSFPPDRATLYANALMDLGSLVCTASEPRCDECPLSEECRSKGERPEEAQERVKRRQPTFRHSNRWWRGRILKALARDASLSRKALFQKILKEKNGERVKRPGEETNPERFFAALEQLADEGLITTERRVRVKE